MGRRPERESAAFLSGDVVARVRAREYPRPDGGIFFNTASWGLVPASAAEEVADLTRRRTLAFGFEEAELGAIQRRCREALATLLDVEAREIALVPNTSYGVNLAVALAASGPPGTVLVSRGEFPANVLPWRTLEPRGFRVELVETDAAGRPDEELLLERLIDPAVRVLAVSAVQYASGVRMSLERLGAACRERGALFCVDAIQAVGVVPFRPRDLHVDVVACGGQKWLCSPWGSGFAWIAERHHGRFEPPMVSWLSMEGALRFDEPPGYGLDWLESARRFELGTNGVQDYLGLARATEVLLEMGVDAVRAHVLSVLEPLVSWVAGRGDVAAVTPTDPERRGGIFAFVPPDAEAVARALAGLRVQYAVRGGAVRFAPHFYNTRAEMVRVVDALDAALGAA